MNDASFRALIILSDILQRAKDPFLNWAPLQAGKTKPGALHWPEK